MIGTDSPGHFSLIKNGPNISIILTNGTEIKLSNRESWYLTPEAVLDLCMFMTGTPSAVKFRDYKVDVSNVDCQNTRTSWGEHTRNY